MKCWLRWIPTTLGIVVLFTLVCLMLLERRRANKGAINELENYNHAIEMPSLNEETKSEELYQIMNRQYVGIKHGAYEGSPYKKILFWNHFKTLNGHQEFGVGIGREGFKEAGCPVWQCETSMDSSRSKLLEYDAVLFNFRGLLDWDLPTLRSPHQRYIFFAKEAPSWDENKRFSPYLRNFFNWTMTYRWDSDVVHPYGWIEPVDPATLPLHPNKDVVDRFIRNNDKENFAAGKTKMAVWFVSNCFSFSGRNELVQELEESGVQVDKYGECGNMTCGRSMLETFVRLPAGEDEECRQMVDKNYKFYLALENSLCLDYVSERFFMTLSHRIIPIVTDAHGHHARYAPPHSYINTRDFPTVRHLADYLILLDRNDALYNEYFWWKEHYRIRNGVLEEGLHYRTFCNLCAALHDPTRHTNSGRVKSIYGDMKKWWKDESKCVFQKP